MVGQISQGKQGRTQHTSFETSADETPNSGTALTRSGYDCNVSGALEQEGGLHEVSLFPEFNRTIGHSWRQKCECILTSQQGVRSGSCGTAAN